MKIAIIGAGISGLTFAAAMRHAAPQIEIELYERDPSLESRTQGYSLGLRGDAGLAVLKTLGVYERIASEAVTITDFVFCDQRGHRLLALPATGNAKRLTQRITREALRLALLTAIPTVPVQFGHDGAGYRQGEQGIAARFADDSQVDADYLVACDGAGSALRQQMLGDTKHYLGLTVRFGEAPPTIQHPLLEGGYFLTLGDDGSSVFCYRQPGSIHVSYVVHAASDAELAAQPPAELLQSLQHATKTWHAPIPEIAAAIDPATTVVHGYYDKEPTERVHEGRLWLIGDAAHPMCPFQGQGANLAMVDALELAQYFAALVTAPAQEKTLAAALEADIIKRGRKAVLASRHAAARFHATSRWQQQWRNLGFRFGNFFIGLGARGGPGAHAQHDR